MKKILLSALAMMLLFGSVGAAVRADDDDDAEGMKPLVIIASSGYDALRGDLDYLGKVSGNPDLAQGLEGYLGFFTQGQGLAGLDKSRPWGATFRTDGAQFQLLAFLPVKDLEKLLGALSQLTGEAEDLGDGLWHIERENGSVYVKEQDGWAYLAQSKEGFGDLPEDPVALLAGLNEEYDLAVRAYIQNVPEFFRQMAVDQIKQGLEQALQQQEDETDEQYEIRSSVARRQMESMQQGIEELEELTIGWNIDSENERLFVDLAGFVEDGEAAQGLANLSENASELVGFLLPGAAVRVHVNATMAEAEIEQNVALLETLEAQVYEEIDNDEEIDGEEVKDELKELVGDIVGVLKATVEDGHLNAGLTVTGEAPFTIAAGALVANGEQLQESVRKLLEFFAEQDEKFPEAEYDVEEYEEVSFHTIEIPIPEGDDDDEGAENVRRVFGETLRFTLAFGEDRAFIALGEDGIDTIKAIIDGPETELDNVPPMQLVVALAPIIRFAAELDDADAQTKALAEELDEDEQDELTISLTAEGNTVRYRFEADEGVIRLLGAGAKAAAAAQGVGG